MRLILTATLAAILTCSARADYAVISATTEGFAGITPDFYGVSFLAGDVTSSISSVTFTLPSGSFMSPITIDLASLVGLSAADIQFAGANTRAITVSFTPGSFEIGDSLHFDSEAEVGGSKLGGAFGAGASFSAMLEDGSTGSVFFRTNTSVDSVATLQIPEPSSILMLSLGLAFAWRPLSGRSCNRLHFAGSTAETQSVATVHNCAR